MQRGVKGAAVGIIEEKREPEDYSGNRNPVGRWFKVSAAASVGASMLCTEVSTGHPHTSSATRLSSRNGFRYDYFCFLNQVFYVYAIPCRTDREVSE